MVKKINYPYPTEKINHFIGFGNGLKMVSKYFKYEKQYSETPYLSSLKIITKSDIQDAYFDIILYTPNQLGIPSNIVNEKQIRCYAKNDISENIVDIRQYQIRFPKQGFFTVINWINSDANTSSFTYHRGKSKEERHLGKFVQPTIGTYPSEDSNTFLLDENGWTEVTKRGSIFNDYENKYHNLAIGLELSK